MGKSKSVSKNDLSSRTQAKEFTYNNQKIKPTLFIPGGKGFFAAEYEASGELVVGPNGQVLTWSQARG